MKQKTIAKILNIHPASWTMKRKGRRKLTLSEAEILSDNFGKNVIWWLKASPEQLDKQLGVK